MSLKKCLDCSTQVSTKAITCPNCGNILRKPERGFFGLLFKYTFIAFNIAMPYFIYLSMASASDALETAGRFEMEGVIYETGFLVTGILAVWVVGGIVLLIPVLLTRPKY